MMVGFRTLKWLEQSNQENVVTDVFLAFADASESMRVCQRASECLVGGRAAVG